MNDKWERQKKAIKATQSAFEMEQQVARTIRVKAAHEGLTPSDQIRKLLGLSYSAPKRPRLTVSLSPDDYAILGARYHIDPANTIAIKRRMMKELAACTG